MMRSGTPILILLGITLGPTGLVGPPEYQVKAAYVYNFAKFIEWPKGESFGSLTVCICGKDPFGGFLDEAVRGKFVHGLPIVVRRLSPGEENGDGCQVLFFGSTKGEQIESLLRRLDGRSIVTVGESDSFAERGACSVWYSITAELSFTSILELLRPHTCRPAPGWWNSAAW